MRLRQWHSCVGRQWNGGRRGRYVLGRLILVKMLWLGGDLGHAYIGKRRGVLRLGGMGSSHSRELNRLARVSRAPV
jgi:hypothetical protein